MSKQYRTIGLLAIVALVVAFAAYAYTAPYERFPGIVIGGELTPPPDDWRTVNDPGVSLLKLGGFPPFVIKIVHSADEGGIITATRPDGGYWAQRLRSSDDAHGWIRVGDRTYALNAREIVGDARTPYLESYGGKNGMSMGHDFTGEIIPGQNEPLHTWEVFYWTAR
ncbi:MAG: hypothetical protein ACR2PR_03940 [Pseudohongiellaceae bacterium]